MTDIQKRILEIFKVVASICDEEKIPYYAIGGTCIGAVRHKGFIPWDDDLDIAIPIEYYDLFEAAAKRHLPIPYYLYTADNIKSYNYIWLKVCDSTTTFIEKSEYDFTDAYKGVFVDIMPMAGVPVDKKKQKKFIRKLSIYHRLNLMRRFPNKSNGLIRRIVRFPFWLFVRLFRYNYFSQKYLHLLRTNPVRVSKDIGYTWDVHSLPKLVFPKSWFDDGIDMRFEDTFIKCPSCWNEYLSRQFGDYMALPPIEQRAIHNGFVDLKHSYKDYVISGIPKKD